MITLARNSLESYAMVRPGGSASRALTARSMRITNRRYGHPVAKASFHIVFGDRPWYCKHSAPRPVFVVLALV